MFTGKNCVRQNELGGWRVGELDVSLDSVVIAYRQGCSAETIQQLYPALTLEEVYGAIAFYLANQAAVQQYLGQQDKKWNELRRRSRESPSPVVARLRSILSRAARRF
jgi:hypothetical protein